MPTVEKTSSGEVYVRDIGTFRPSEQRDVSESDAEYLVEERGDFVRVGDDPDDEETGNSSLDDLTYDELMERARKQDISGRSQMDKADLVDALQED